MLALVDNDNQVPSPPGKGWEFYPRPISSRRLQVNAELALLYDVLGSPNPFAECLVPRFAPEKTELRYYTARKWSCY
jgi:hypothetical protein